MRADDEPEPVQRPNDNDALLEARERAREVRRQFVREWNRHGSVSDESKVTAAEVAIDYRDVLIDYREEVATPPWDERDLDWIVELIGETVERERQRSGLGRGVKTERRPAFVDVNAIRLYQLTKKFDQIWRELGFGAETDPGNNTLYMIPDGSEESEQQAEEGTQ